jgi:hypothetical protein
MIATKEEALDGVPTQGSRMIEAIQSAGAGLSHAAPGCGLQLSDPVMSAVLGSRQADALVLGIRGGCAAPDALHEALQAIVAAGDVDLVRAFARRLQKALERAA